MEHRIDGEEAVQEESGIGEVQQLLLTRNGRVYNYERAQGKFWYASRFLAIAHRPTACG